MGDRFPEQAESHLTYLVDQKNGDRMIKQLLNSVIAKYRDLSVSHRSIIYLSLLLRQIIDLLATDNSQYFAQPRSIIVKYVLVVLGLSLYYINTSEIPSELSRESIISSQLKITCYLHT